MRKRLLAITIAVIIVAGAAAAVSVKRRQLRNLPAPAQPALPVAAALVVRGSAFGIVSTTALLRADSASTVSAQAAGAILEMRVREGDRVLAGQILARIDARPLDDAVDAASARLVAAKRALAVQEAVFGRDTALRDGGAISQQAFDASAAQLESARAATVTAERARSTTRVQRSFADVRAPYSGVITARMAEAGDFAAPGKPLYAVERPGTVRVISKFSQDVLQRIRPGDEVTFSWGRASIRARVSQIYPALDASSLGSVETLLQAPPFGLPNGASIHADYAAAPLAGLTIPNEALLDGLDSALVVRIVDGRAEPMPVRIVARGARESVIEGAVGAGDVVVTGLPSELMALTKGTAVNASRPRKSS
jgi:RND family efflux transporter MFP subunit